MDKTEDLSPEQLKKKRLADVFGRAAPTYDRVGPPVFSHFGKRLVEEAGISPGSQLLDVATGRGASLFPAAKAVGPTGRVVGVDFSRAMVHEAMREIRAKNLKNVEAQHMDAEALLFPDESFDLVLSGFAIFFFPNLDKALSEFHRVLRPVGKVAVSTFAKVLPAEWEWLEPLLEKFVPMDQEEDQRDESAAASPEFDSEEGLSEILSSAGFLRVQVSSETKDFVYADEEEWWSTVWSHGMRQSLEKIQETSGVDALADFQFEAFEELRKMKKPDGIHQEITALFAVGRKL